MKTIFFWGWVLSSLLSSQAWAQNYPSKPIRLVVPFAAGGTTDLMARIVAEPLGKLLGQTVVVDNKAGGGGVLGAAEVARAAADGYTLGLATASSNATNPAINPKVPYDPLRDFSPITNMAATPNVLAINPSFPAKDFAGLLAELRRKPGHYDYASSGTGGIGHLQMELFKNLTKTFIVHIPYSGGGPALRDTLGGQVMIIFDNLPSALPHIKDKRLIAMAVATPERLPELPGVPTFKELGLEPVNRPAFYGIYGPKGLPLSVRNRLAAETAKAAATPDFIAKMEGLGFQARTGNPAEFDAYLKTETSKWAKVVKDAGVPQE